MKVLFILKRSDFCTFSTLGGSINPEILCFVNSYPFERVIPLPTRLSMPTIAVHFHCCHLGDAQCLRGHLAMKINMEVSL